MKGPLLMPPMPPGTVGVHVRMPARTRADVNAIARHYGLSTNAYLVMLIDRDRRRLSKLAHRAGR
jgi:hypothetical protein